jgi:hypothetical protein
MHAFDLFAKWRENLRFVYDKIIERVDETPLTGSVILSAMKGLAG